VGTESEVARAQSDLYLFEQRRLETLSAIAEQQLVLRNLMGLPPNDCRDIVLLAVPTTTRPTETLPCAVQRAINSRPDVLRQRLAVYIASQERLLAENNLQPQLDLNGFWQTNGLGEDLDQSFESKDTNDFESWQMGVFFQIPLGRRQGRAELQAAQLRISRERAMLEQTAHQASYEVVDAYRRLNWIYQQLEIAANRERALNQWSEGARATFENPPPGVTTIFALEMYLNNLRNMTDASFTKNALLADYNSALARLAEVTGSLLENRLVEIAGDASDTLPSRLPPAEIQLPEAVAPVTPAQPQPVQPAPPQPAQPAPAEPAPAPAQPQPQGNPPQAIVPPTGSPLAEAPRSQPLPSIQMPESLQAQDAYANLPVTPAPATTPAAEPAPAVEAPIAAAPVMAPAPIEAPRPAPVPMEMAQEPPVIVPEPIAVAPVPMAAPSLEMPQSMLPEPTRTAMRPEPVKTPNIEAPLAAEPMAETPAAPRPRTETPRAESPALRQPAAVARQREVVPAAPPQHSIVNEGPSLVMPKSVAAPPEAVQSPPRQAVRSGARPNQEPTLQLPGSVSAASQRIERPRQAAAPANARAPSVSLRMPTSVQGAGAAAPKVSQHVRPLQPVPSVNAAQRTAAGPRLAMPSSVRPANAEAQVRQTNTSPRVDSEMEPAAVRGAALQFPSSVGPVTR
ncbi:MAG TPA: TolC family protein, partial [Lacipirellula sp.]